MRNKKMTKNLSRKMAVAAGREVNEPAFNDSETTKINASPSIGAGQLSATFGGPAPCDSVGPMSLKAGWGFVRYIFAKEKPSINFD